MKILVIRTDVHGDVLVATCVLPGLRAAFPDAQIDFWATDPYGWSLEHNPYIDRVMTRPQRSSYDLVIELDHHVRWTEPSARIYHYQVNEAIQEQLGLEVEIPLNPPNLHFTEDDAVLTTLEPGWIAVAARAGWRNREFDHMDEVLAAFPQETFVQVERVVSAHRLKASNVRYAGDYSLRKVAWMMQGCQLYLGVDTAFMHIAVALGKPMVLALNPTTHKLHYIPHASIVYSQGRDQWPLNALPEAPDMQVDPRDLTNALGERLAGKLAGDNPRIVYTDGMGLDWRP